MKKYIYIFKSEIMSSLQYVFDTLFGFIGFFIIFFIFMNLWNYIYQDPNELINGYSMNQMIWYVAVTEILWSTISGRKYARKIVNDVKTGNIAYNLNKPYSYIGYSLAGHMGDCIIKLVIYTILGFLVGYLFMGEFPNITILEGLIVLLVSIISLVINTLLITFVGLFSFVVEDSNPFYWLYSKLILVFGTLFPIEFFPEAIRVVLEYSPIYAVSYGPAKLFVDFSYGELFTVLITQGVYLVISILLCVLMYKKGVKNLNVNGG